MFGNITSMPCREVGPNANDRKSGPACVPVWDRMSGGDPESQGPTCQRPFPLDLFRFRGTPYVRGVPGPTSVGGGGGPKRRKRVGKTRGDIVHRVPSDFLFWQPQAARNLGVWSVRTRSPTCTTMLLLLVALNVYHLERYE